MRHIEKESAPTLFTALAETPGANWNDSASGPTKREAREYLMREQFGLCGFCCSFLPDPPANAGEEDLRRVAHVVPQDVDPTKSLDWRNVVLSCSSGRRHVGQYIDPLQLSCDEAQGNRNIPVTPTQTDCESRFRYRSSGAIIASDPNDGDATMAIFILNLRASRLEAARAAAIQAAQVELELLEAADDRSALIDRLLAVQDGRLPEYEPALRQFLTG